MAEIFLFGDSITWGSWDPIHGGWAQQLRAEIDRIQLGSPEVWCPVYNLGIPGDTAAGIARRLENEICARHEATQEIVIVVAVGVNDSLVSLPSNDGLVTPAEFTESLVTIHTAAIRHSAKIAFVGLVPVDEPRVNPLPWDHQRAYTFERAKLFDDTLSMFCKNYQLPFVDLWSSWLSKPWRSFLYDGLHPNSEGHLCIFHEVRALVIDRFSVCAQN